MEMSQTKGAANSPPLLFPVTHIVITFIVTLLAFRVPGISISPLPGS